MPCSARCATPSSPDEPTDQCGGALRVASDPQPRGRFAEAIPCFEKAVRLSPYDPQRWAFYSYRAFAHLLAGEFEQSLDWAQRATRLPNCHYWPFAHRVAALGHLQRDSEFPGALAELRRRSPNFCRSFARRRLFYIKNPEHLERYLEGLRKAGVTEHSS
jgi:tetratricopeptide (TPR) repeat protein